MINGKLIVSVSTNVRMRVKACLWQAVQVLATSTCQSISFYEFEGLALSLVKTTPPYTNYKGNTISLTEHPPLHEQQGSILLAYENTPLIRTTRVHPIGLSEHPPPLIWTTRVGPTILSDHPCIRVKAWLYQLVKTFPYTGTNGWHYKLVRNIPIIDLKLGHIRFLEHPLIRATRFGPIS